MNRAVTNFCMVAVCAGLALAAALRFATRSSKPVSHNCRMWAMVTADPMKNLDGLVRSHLDSLQKLGVKNADGWGIAYYLRPDTAVRLPVIRRGEPSAPSDPRWGQTVDEIARYASDAAMAHIRKATAGLTTGIPGPHPFDRRSNVLNLRILFSHNGAIPVATLLDLIQKLNPFYLGQNPPDYNPNYIDSDLYCLYILENIDTYIDSTYEACIRTAVAQLDSALGVNYPAYLNFVMTDGSTVWALRFADEAVNTYGLYYYPDTGSSNTWAAASEPLDTFSSYWKSIPNKTLVTLIPGHPPRFTAMDWPKAVVRERSLPNLTLNYRSVNRRAAAITFDLTWPGRCRMEVFNETGRRQRILLDEYRGAGSYAVFWNGQDDRNVPLPSGKYFLVLTVDGLAVSEKIVLLQ